jgi:hypothetical protein
MVAIPYQRQEQLWRWKELEDLRDQRMRRQVSKQAAKQAIKHT